MKWQHLEGTKKVATEIMLNTETCMYETTARDFSVDHKFSSSLANSTKRMLSPCLRLEGMWEGWHWTGPEVLVILTMCLYKYEYLWFLVQQQQFKYPAFFFVFTLSNNNTYYILAYFKNKRNQTPTVYILYIFSPRQVWNGREKHICWTLLFKCPNSGRCSDNTERGAV